MAALLQAPAIWPPTGPMPPSHPGPTPRWLPETRLSVMGMRAWRSQRQMRWRPMRPARSVMQMGPRRRCRLRTPLRGFRSRSWKSRWQGPSQHLTPRSGRWRSLQTTLRCGHPIVRGRSPQTCLRHRRRTCRTRPHSTVGCSSWPRLLRPNSSTCRTQGKRASLGATVGTCSQTTTLRLPKASTPSSLATCQAKRVRGAPL
mmetsp:Transcript_106205/g.282577  ORF Transcript_106205/g.282577 Transcript_106205/m.282577 type:complete len:201 (+) Transcript_106205:571-1173(+)